MKSGHGDDGYNGDVSGDSDNGDGGGNDSKP